MSHTTTATNTTRWTIPWKSIVAAAVALAFGAALGLTVLQEPETDQSAVARDHLTHQEFLELNTTALPPTAQIAGASESVADRFIELNTTSLPTDPATPSGVSDEFTYWNVGSFGPAAADRTPDVGANSTGMSGPR